ncbi:MAG: polysaccharide deacetylase [Ruminococcaceae bacterium]|nr:polysaccharide deacetylase [Oscillospiraceae bacterium]
MIQFHVYPGGKKRIVTFSYDDGAPQDERLVELFNKYSVKATFHLNGNNYIGKTEEELEKIGKLYEGHEISCHTLLHGWPTRMPAQSLVGEVMEDRKILEKIAGYPVIGMSYPSGSFNDRVVDILSACGIVYSRTVRSTKYFELPDNFLEWHPSCHHKDAKELAKYFLDSLDSIWTAPLFYIWGHSHELKTEDDWKYMEDLVSVISSNDKIWYATNIDIYNYITAQKNLQISTDEKVFYNPSSLDLWVEKDKKQIIKIPAGQTVRI